MDIELSSLFYLKTSKRLLLDASVLVYKSNPNGFIINVFYYYMTNI